MDMEEDDWLDDSGPSQGGATDPLTNVEYDRIASKYSDVSTVPVFLSFKRVD
jgi:hypothetical protein